MTGDRRPRGVREPAANLDTNQLTWTATEALLALDATFVGTPDYMGLAYYWASAYKERLRPATYRRRRLVHTLLLQAGLPLDGQSDLHEAIITDPYGDRRTA